MLRKEAAMAPRLREGCILYFFLFMSHGVVGPFLPLIWQDKGFTEDEVGVLGAIRPGVSFFAVPAICALADRTGMHQQVLYALLVLYGFARPLVLVAGGMLAVGALEVMASISEAPANSLVDSGARHTFGVSGYGKLRMWGGFGFGVASVIGGYIFDVGGGGYNDVMITFVTLTLGAMVAATLVPVGKDAKAFEESDDDSSTSGEEHDDNGDRHVSTNGLEKGSKDKHADTGVATRNATSPDRGSNRLPVGNTPDRNGVDETGEPSVDGDHELGLAQNGVDSTARSAVWRALRTVDAVSFLTTVVLSGMGSGFIDTFLFIRLEELGGSHTLFGIARLIMCLAEVPFFYISGPLLRRSGPRSVAALAQLGFLARFRYYAVLRDPWWVLPAEVLHGLTFAAMWAATIEYAHQVAPVGSETTMVGILSGLHQGLGVGLGALVGGFMYAGLGPTQCFSAFAALPMINLLMLALPAAMRCLHIGGGNGRKGGMIDEEGLDGWGGAKVDDIAVPDERHLSGSERGDEDSNGNGLSNGKKTDRNVGSSGRNGQAQRTATPPSSARVASE